MFGFLLFYIIFLTRWTLTSCLNKLKLNKKGPLLKNNIGKIWNWCYTWKLFLSEIWARKGAANFRRMLQLSWIIIYIYAWFVESIIFLKAIESSWILSRSQNFAYLDADNWSIPLIAWAFFQAQYFSRQRIQYSRPT